MALAPAGREGEFVSGQGQPCKRSLVKLAGFPREVLKRHNSDTGSTQHHCTCHTCLDLILNFFFS